jgi:prepilin-type processing-associated H-X9-DG protein
MLAESTANVSVTPHRVPLRRCWHAVRYAVAIAVFGGVAAVLASGAQAYLHASWCTRCVNHLKQVGMAMHKYHYAHEHFPAPAIRTRDGRALLSWRVALLPQLGYQSLYNRFRLDEPWDSPHNLTLLAEMPAECVCPAAGTQASGQTPFRVVVGPKTEPTSVNTPFEPGRGVEIHEITDGTTNTILVLETKALVPWTKPDDLVWSKDLPLPTLASSHPVGANVLFADGTTRFLKRTNSATVFRSRFTINGGEVISA